MLKSNIFYELMMWMAELNLLLDTSRHHNILQNFGNQHGV